MNKGPVAVKVIDSKTREVKIFSNGKEAFDYVLKNKGRRFYINSIY